MVYFVGAGSGAADLITVRGKNLLEKADVIIYAGSLVNPELLTYAKEDCEIHNSAYMTLDEVIAVMENAEKAGKTVVRLHTGEPSIYGAVREQMDLLDEKGITYESCPGVSACFGAASSLNLEYTLPGISQSLIITRMEGKTKVPPKESIESFAAHQASMAIYLSTGMLEELSGRLTEGGYPAETPAALVYKATWPEEACFVTTIEKLAQTAAEHGITKTAIVLVGDVIAHAGYENRGYMHLILKQNSEKDELIVKEASDKTWMRMGKQHGNQSLCVYKAGKTDHGKINRKNAVSSSEMAGGRASAGMDRGGVCRSSAHPVCRCLWNSGSCNSTLCAG